jgi:hypothetical protein
MEFKHDAGERIKPSEFKKLREAYTAKHPEKTQAHYMGRHAFEKLLALPGCAGIRSYHGLDEKGTIVHMMVAYDANNHPLKDAQGYVIMEKGQGCPPTCNTETTISESSD